MSNSPQDNDPQRGPAPGQGASQPEGGNPYVGQNPSKFGTEAYDANAYGGPVEQPKKYELLKTVTLVSFGLYLVSGIIGLIPMFTGEAEDMAREQLEGQDLGGMSVDDALAAGMAFSWIFVLVPLVISIVLYLLVYFGLKNSKSWARTLGIVMAFIGLLLTVAGLLLGPAAYGTTIGMVALVLSLAWVASTLYWLILAFSPEVGRYLREVKR